jgi:hypothetical protein
MEEGMSRMKSFVVILTAASLLAAGCASSEERHLSSDPAVPAAEGRARFGTAKNDNVSIDLVVKHLAPPEKLSPPAANYVVWLQPSKSVAPQNIGALKVDKDLTGSLETVTPQHRFDLFITAEGSGQVQSPAGKQLLWTSYAP